MKRWSLILPVFTLSFIFALDDNVKVQEETQQQKQIVASNDITVPIDVDNLQRIRKTDQFKERTLEHNSARLKRGNPLKQNSRFNSGDLDAINFSDIKKKMDRKREIDKRRKYNNIPSLQEQISGTFNMPQKSKDFREAQLKRKNSLKQKYQVESNTTNTIDFSILKEKLSTMSNENKKGMFGNITSFTEQINRVSTMPQKSSVFKKTSAFNNILNSNSSGNINPSQWNSRDSWWFETFDIDATPDANYMLSSDYTWLWWGWGTAEVSSGDLHLTGDSIPDPIWGGYSSVVSIDEYSDPDIEIHPTNALIATRLKFTTEADSSFGWDYFVTFIAMDPNFLSQSPQNFYYTLVQPDGIVFANNFADTSGISDTDSTFDIGYDQYFWQVIAMDGDTVSVWVLPDTAEVIPDEPNIMFTINLVTDVVEPLESLVFLASTYYDSSTVHIDQVYYSTLDDFDDSEFEYAGSFGESDYYFSNVDTTWYEADDMSDNAGGHLVTISSEEENDFIYSLIQQTGNNSWIGFSDIATEGDWVWTTGEDVVYTNWAAGEPNDLNGEDCAEMFMNGTWNDNQCDWDRAFIMEVDNYIDLEFSNFTIELNGEESAELAAGSPLVVTITFDSAAADPNAGLMHIFYDINMNGELNDDDFIVVGDIIIVDNDEFDENPAVGIVQATFDPNDPWDDDQGILFWLTMQNTTWFFAGLDFDNGGYYDVATLDVTGWNPPGMGASISGSVDPATPNLLTWAWGPDTYYYPHAAMTDANGVYEMDTDVGQYDVYMWDIFGQLGPNMVITPNYQWVDVDGGVTDVDFELLELTTMVYGVVADENGNPVMDVGINFWNDSLGIYSYGWTGEDGYYETWVLGDDYYYVNAYANGYYDFYADSVYIDDRDDVQYNITLESYGDVNSVIHGYVYDMYGQGIPYASVDAWSDEIAYGVYTQTDDYGWYSLEVIGGYDYYVSAWAEGLEYYTEFVYVEENGEIWIDFYLYDPWYEEPPIIVYAGDVPNDQGRQMRLVWYPGQPGYWNYFTQYSIWRLVPEAPEELWDYVTTVPWWGMGLYSTVVPTLGDSTAAGIYWSTFMVTAHTEDPNYFLDSWPAIGYSIDNLPPGVPTGFAAAIGASGVELVWDISSDEDFQYFRLDKSTDGNFSNYQSIETINTTYLDTEYEVGVTLYYRISALDHSGNMGEFSPTVDITVLWADLENAMPSEYTIHQNYPNPFNPSTTLRYALPEQSDVKIAVYDMIGRKVRTLVNDSQDAGYKSVIWDATNDYGERVGAGIYLYQIQAGAFVQTRKMVLLK